MKNRPAILKLILVLLVLLMMVSCTRSPQDQGKTDQSGSTDGQGTSAEVAAMVNGSPIMLSEVRTAINNIALQNGMSLAQTDALLNQIGPRILEQLIDGELLFTEAVRKGLEAPEDEVQTAFTSLSGQFETPEQFQAEMQTRGYTEETLKENMRKQITIRKLIDQEIVPSAEVPEETIREAYDSNPQNFVRPEEVQASHILIKSSSSDPQEKKDEALDRAREIASRARQKDADFAELAKKYSEGPSAPQGGDLGYFSQGRMVKPFEDAAFSMQVDEVSEPVLTEFGYHIIKVTGKRPGGKVTFDEVREKLALDLKNRMVNELITRKISDLRQSAAIEVRFQPAATPAPSPAPSQQQEGGK
ncbi:MAG: peptidylprolyl isomerase [bacterium]|nr:MAG: peptidylprolyl isomerase [bacterium]